MQTVETYPANQWVREGFWKLVEREEACEVRVAAAYERPVDRGRIREQVLDAILTHAIPAGNA